MGEESKKPGTVSQLMAFAGSYKWLTVVGCILSGIAMLLSMAVYVCIWQVVNAAISVAPDWSQASAAVNYGWAALWFALGSIVVYFFALMCSHGAAFRVATNIRKECVRKLLHAPLGYFDNHASGMLRRRISDTASEGESFLAHSMPDIAGTVVLAISMVVLLFVFDWRMGLSCLVIVVISLACMAAMMGGNSQDIMKDYEQAMDDLSKSATEYVRGIPVVKVFQQTVDSFKVFKRAIDEYSQKASEYESSVCKAPQSLNLTFVEGSFLFLVPVVIILAPGADNFALFITNFAFYAVFSGILSTALARIMFSGGYLRQAEAGLAGIKEIMNAPQVKVAERTSAPKDSSVQFDHVTFTYDEGEHPALDNVSFDVPAGATVALVGPSGGGKSTAASLVPRFWDVQHGSVRVGGVDVREIDPKLLMDQVAFVFQNSRLFKTSIYENVHMARPSATREEVMQALSAAQCNDIIEKLPEGVDTLVGTGGTFLSGGERQRIVLARAFLKDAPIVVLDEATAFADPDNEALIQRALNRLMSGRTVLMIAHRLSTVVDADRIIVLDKGHVAEEGTHQQLVAAGGEYARMWSDYNHVLTWSIGRKEAADVR